MQTVADSCRHEGGMGQIFRRPLWTAPKPKTKINETFFATHLSDRKIPEVRRLKASLILFVICCKKLFLNRFDLIWLSFGNP